LALGVIFFDSGMASHYSVHAMNTQHTKPSQAMADKESQLTLELLQAIDQKDDISQRDLAQGMGVALGLANSYLKRCVKKGWIKISTAPANRYLYYLTPTGFAEKARLTADFFATSLTLFRQSGDVYSQVFQECVDSDHRKIALAGLSDLTEIALMRSTQFDVDVIEIFQPAATRSEFFGVKVKHEPPQPNGFDRIVLTSMEQTAELLRVLEADVADEQIIVPSLLLNMNYRNQDHESQLESGESP